MPAIERLLKKKSQPANQSQIGSRGAFAEAVQAAMKHLKEPISAGSSAGDMLVRAHQDDSLTGRNAPPIGNVLVQLRRLMEAHAQASEWRLPSERDLAEMFGVGRRAVRAALATLAAENRIWRQQGKGTFAGARPPFCETLAVSLAQKIGPLEVMEARLEIEPGLARLAAAKAPPEVVSRLDALRRQLALATTPEQMEKLDGAFHRQVAETAGNRLLLMTFDVIDRIRTTPSWREARAHVRNAERLRVTDEQHENIVAAIGRHDGRGAEFSMRQHLLTLHAHLQDSLYGRSAQAQDE